MQKKIDEIANMWNKTKDPKYKDLWYKLSKGDKQMDLIILNDGMYQLVPLTKQMDGT